MTSLQQCMTALEKRITQEERDFYLKCYDQIPSKTVDGTLFGDIFNQVFPRRSVPVFFDGYLLANFWSRLVAGSLLISKIEVGATPGNDSERQANAAKLANLPSGFIAKVDATQNCADSDGALILTNTSHVSPCGLPSYSLEIGYCEPFTIWRHITDSCGVCRWPYGSTMLWLIESTSQIVQPTFNYSKPKQDDQLSLFG